MEATIEAIKELRAKTGAGVGAVKEALVESSSMDDAITFLRKKGVAKAAKRAGKSADNGTLGLYKHSDNRLIVTVEVVTETDFASRGEDVQKFANDIALHIAAMNTEYVSENSVPESVLEQERKVGEKDVEGKPKDIAEKILEGKINKFYEQNVLTRQKLFTDDSKTVQDYLNELVAKVGEKIKVTKFVKVSLGNEAIISELKEEE